MAIILTSATPEERYTPFTGLTQSLRENSGIARAEVVYSIYQGSWANPGAGNIRNLAINITLDNNYAYVLTDINTKFYSGSTQYLESTGVCDIQLTPGSTANEIVSTQLISDPSRQDSAATAIGSITAAAYNDFYPAGPSGIAVNRVFRLAEPKPSYLIYPFQNPKVNSIVNVRFAEPNNSFQDITYNFVCRFLQYDISQGYHWAINTPVPTR